MAGMNQNANQMGMMPGAESTAFQREMERRRRNAMVGQQVSRQIDSMRQVSPDGILRDPNFIRYQADVIKGRMYKNGFNGFIRGGISARDLADMEDYLKSVTDSEVVSRFPYFFDFQTDGANYFLDQERELAQESAEPMYYGNPYGYDGAAEY